MSLFIATYSALRYLERSDALRTPAPVESLESSECSLRALVGYEPKLRSLGIRESPLHLLVDDRNKANASDWFVCHRWERSVPPGSFVMPVRDICVSTPEFCFLQMAGALPRIALIRFGYELCATYRLDPLCERGFEERAPLTTPAQLEGYLSNAEDSCLVRKAKEALRWVAANSASPRETALSMMLSLPTEMGGCEFGLPQLNYKVAVGDGEMATRRIDLCWEAEGFGLEYDSDLEHTGAAKISADSIREKEIELQGFVLTRVTNAELKSESGRDLLFRTVRKGLGRRNSKPSDAALFKRRQLAAMLLAPHDRALPETLLV